MHNPVFPPKIFFLPFCVPQEFVPTSSNLAFILKLSNHYLPTSSSIFPSSYQSFRYLRSYMYLDRTRYFCTYFYFPLFPFLSLPSTHPFIPLVLLSILLLNVLSFANLFLKHPWQIFVHTCWFILDKLIRWLLTGINELSLVNDYKQFAYCISFCQFK